MTRYLLKINYFKSRKKCEAEVGCQREIWVLSKVKEQRRLTRQIESQKTRRQIQTRMTWSERYSLKSMKNGISLDTVAGGPESSREGEGGSSETLCTNMKKRVGVR